MNYLLDTHTLIWFLEDDKALSKRAKARIEDSESKVFVSIVALWEIAIKTSLRKLTISRTIDEILIEIEELEIKLLPIDPDAVKQVQNIPFHHRDPFDRMMICQAQVNDYTVITRDPAFKDYAVDVFW